MFVKFVLRYVCSMFGWFLIKIYIIVKEVKIEILDYKNLLNNVIMNKKEIYND